MPRAVATVSFVLLFSSGAVGQITVGAMGDSYSEEYRLLDPNSPGDANHAAIHPNLSIALTMMDDREVVAVFGCGSGLPVPLLLLAAMGLTACRFAHKGH